MLRLPWKDQADRPSRLRWWIGDPSRRLRYVGAWRVILPVAILVFIPSFIAVLAALNGPFVVALVLFSPFASLLMLVAITLLLAAGTGARRFLREVAAGIALRGDCPACGYPLGESDAQGLSRCPECGGTWTLVPSPPPHRVVVTRSWPMLMPVLDQPLSAVAPGQAQRVGAHENESAAEHLEPRGTEPHVDQRDEHATGR